MAKYIISIDQSTQGTKALLFTLVTTCYLMSTKASIYQESRHLIENPCQYK